MINFCCNFYYKEIQRTRNEGFCCSLVSLGASRARRFWLLVGHGRPSVTSRVVVRSHPALSFLGTIVSDLSSLVSCSVSPLTHNAIFCSEWLGCCLVHDLFRPKARTSSFVTIHWNEAKLGCGSETSDFLSKVFMF